MQRHHFAENVHVVKAKVFPIVMYGSESWTIKKAEDAFELWCWRKLLRVPCRITIRRSNQSILNEINPVYTLEGLMLKLKLQNSGHLMWRANSLEKDSDAGKHWGEEEKGVTEDKIVGWHHYLNGHEFEQLWEIVTDREAWHAIVHRVAELDTTEQLNNTT